MLRLGGRVRPCLHRSRRPPTAVVLDDHPQHHQRRRRRPGPRRSPAAAGTCGCTTTARATQWGVSLWEFQVFGGRRLGAADHPTADRADRAGRPSSSPTARSHRLPDDPIVYPGLPGASHMHSFFGSRVTNAYTDVSDLLAGATATATRRSTRRRTGSRRSTSTTCRSSRPPASSTTWVRVSATTSSRRPSRCRWACASWPATRRPRRRTTPPSPAGPVCTTTRRARRKDFLTCPAGSMMESYLDFPQCWNGRDLDSADHKSHMAYPVNSACPATHPVPVPKLRQVLRYPVERQPGAVPAGVRSRVTPCTATSSTPGPRPRWSAACATASARSSSAESTAPPNPLQAHPPAHPPVDLGLISANCPIWKAISPRSAGSERPSAVGRVGTRSRQLSVGWPFPAPGWANSRRVACGERRRVAAHRRGCGCAAPVSVEESAVGRWWAQDRGNSP